MPGTTPNEIFESNSLDNEHTSSQERAIKVGNLSKASSSAQIKRLLLLLICLLTIYGPVELTRVIIAWDLSGQFIFEVFYMWLSYAIAIFIISAVLARKRLFHSE